MTSLRFRGSPKTVLTGAMVVAGMVILASSVLAVVPATVDSYGGNSFAAGVHVVVGTNNLSNFDQGAIGNRYPLSQTGQDISPASNATASVDDYGPLIGNVTTADCNKPPPPSPVPDPNAGKPPNYCFSFVQTEAPYAKAQYPNPPGKGHDTAKGAHDTDSGSAVADAKELGAFADGSYSGSPGTGTGVSNATSHAETSVGANGAITVKTHAHVGRACFGACDATNYVVVTDTDVQTIVTAISGRATPNATVAPGHVQYCPTPANCQPVAVDNNGVTVGPTSNIPPVQCPPQPAPCTQPPGTVPVPGTGGSAETTFFRIRTVNPSKSVKGGTGSVDAVGLYIEARQPGNAEQGIPDSTVQYIIGEGHSDGFSSAPLGGGGGLLDLSNAGNTDTGPVAAALNDIAGGGAGGSGGAGSGGSPVKRSVGRPGSAGGSLAGLLRPPFLFWFYVWEASALGGGIALVWARRRRLRELSEEQ